MSTEITPASMFSLVPSAEESAAGGGSSPFVPSMKLVQGMSQNIGTRGLEQGMYDIPTEELNLGKDFAAVFTHRRPHALALEGNKKTLETFNIKSPVWRQIKAIKNDRDKGIVRYVAEADWLIWLPAQEMFVTFLCGQPSTYPLTVDLKVYLTPPPDRKLEVDKDRPFTNHFNLTSVVKTWGKDFRAMSPHIDPLDTFDVNTIDKTKATQATDMFFAPVLAEAKVEETTEESR